MNRLATPALLATVLWERYGRDLMVAALIVAAVFAYMGTLGLIFEWIGEDVPGARP